ncbi:MAG TPA: lipoprotein-releasing ABC transporter permease subunit [Vicinamibacterales bacterium]|jgi:lipoprotein-releasing system permease protein
MNLPYELFIALRYLRARRKQAFISVISLISGIGVAVGVTALLIVLALMTGLQGELRDRIVGSAAHVYVFKSGGLGPPADEIKRVLTVPHVVGAAPVALVMGLARSGGEGQPITLKGVDPKLENTVTNVGRSVEKGSLEALETGKGNGLPGVVIGKDLAQKLGATVGDSIEVLTLEGELTPFGVMPGQRAFKVVGVFSLGLFEFDSSYGYVHIEVAEKLLDTDRPQFIEVRVDELFAARAVADDVPVKLGPDYVAQDWADMNKSLFSALWLEKMAMSITIGLIVMVAALNIIASLILLVMEKTRDIAILKTMGSSSTSISRIFMLQGLIIGTIGTASGAVLGCSLIYVLDRFKLINIPLDVYQISHVPFRLQPLDFVTVIVAAVLICFLATIYPSRQASRLDPAQALRYQ